MLKFKFPEKCPNCNSKKLTGSESCIIYECGGKISITGIYGDVLNYVFKHCMAEAKTEVKKRFNIKKKRKK